MSVKRFLLAGGALALLTSSANAAIQFSLERMPSNAGATGPTTVLLVARDPDATTNFNIAGLSGRFTDQTTNNGLKFVITDTGDYDFTGGVGNAGFGTRAPLVQGSFLYVPSSGVNLADGIAADGSLVSESNDPKYAEGLKSVHFVTTRTGNTVLTPAVLKSASGGVLGAAVLGGALDTVTFTEGSLGSVDPNTNQAAPDLVIPNMTSQAPEPSSLALLGVAAVGLVRRRRKA